MQKWVGVVGAVWVHVCVVGGPAGVRAVWVWERGDADRTQDAGWMGGGVGVGMRGQVGVA